MELSALSLALTRAGLISSSVAFSPLSLFSAGEQGVYFDPNNSATLFEDAAGTIPTALERPVGLMLDLSGRGNHATSSSTARPTLTRRVNLLSNTEDLSSTTWFKQTGTTVSPIKVSAPNGTVTAFSVTGNGSSGIYQAISGTLALGETVRSIYLRVSTGTATVSIKDPVKTQNITVCNLNTNWQRFTLVETTTPTSGFSAGIWVLNIPASGIEIAWPDVRPSNIGVGIPAYQRVGDTAINAADYDTAGFPAWLRCSGGQSMVTPSINFTGTDKMTVWAGARKLSDSTIGTILEVGNLGAVTNGVSMTAPQATATGNYGFQSGGSSLVSVAGATYASPISNVLVGIGDVSGPNATLRANGTQIATSGASQGSGNYGNYPLYLFARNQSSLFFNGLAGPIIVRGAQSSAKEIANAEAWINAQQKVY